VVDAAVSDIENSCTNPADEAYSRSAPAPR
jgi:hypothetical protein